VAENTQMFDSLDLEMRHFAHGQAYGHFKHNPTDLSLGVSTDAFYQHYYSTLAPVQSRREVAFADFVVMGEYDSAQAVLNQYSTAQLWEQNLSTVEQIWLNHLATDSVISTNDSLILYDIACQDPIVFGTGVYSARVILNWDGNCPSFAARSEESSNQEGLNDEVFEIYPVPNTGKFTNFIPNEISTACVNSLNGMKIMDCITNGTNKVEVKTELSPGFYFITIQTMSGTIKSLEFVIE
jgi:hypothetical protein